MFKVWIKDGKNRRPKEDIIYVIASNGNFISKKMPLWESVVPVDKISSLQECVPSVKFFIPPLPGHLVRKVVHFFAFVYKMHKTEVGVLIWYNKDKNRYRITVPKQKVTHGSINYDIKGAPKKPGYVLTGTIHSHADFGASHSHIDENDELSLNGIHITLGEFDGTHSQTHFGASIEASMNGHRFPQDISHWLTNVAKAEGDDKTVDQKEAEKDKKKDDDKDAKEGVNVYSSWSHLSYFSPSYWKKSPDFKFADNGKVLPEDYIPPKSWLKNVNFFKYSDKYYGGIIIEPEKYVDCAKTHESEDHTGTILLPRSTPCGNDPKKDTPAVKDKEVTFEDLTLENLGKEVREWPE